MDGYERRKRKKMGHIYDAAFERFVAYGFHKVSVNEIARQAGVSPATIYNYFGTKEQLYTDTMTHWMDKQLAQVELVLDSDRTFPEKTKEMMLLEARSLKVLKAGLPHLPVSERLDWMRVLEGYGERKVAHVYRKFVALGKQGGYIHPEQTDEITMRYFAMFRNELNRLWEESDGEGASRSIDPWVELFFYGVAGARSDSSPV